MSSSVTTLYDYIEIIVRWRWRIILNVFITGVVAAVISLILPKSYTAESIILPPDDNSIGFSFSSMLEGTPLASLGMPGMSTPASVYLAILKSRETTQAIVDSFSLKQRYNVETIDAALDELRKRVKIDLTDDGMILVRVVDKDPAIAADIANAFVELLNETYTTMNVEKARSNRLFIGKRLKQNITDLTKAEDRLKEFQMHNKTVSLPEQAEASLTIISQLYADRLQLQVQRDILMNSMGTDNPKLRKIALNIEELDRTISNIETGRNRSKAYFPITFADLPTLGLHLARLVREVKIQEAIFELLTQQHEHAKLQEAKDTPSVQVIDHAVPPELRTWPKRTLIVLMCAFLSFALTCAYALLAHYLVALSESATREAVTLNNIKCMLAGDIRNFFRQSGK